MSRKRSAYPVSVAALTTTALAAVAASLAYFIWTYSTSDETSASEETATIELQSPQSSQSLSRQLCVVLDESSRDQCREIIENNPSAVVVGLKDVELESTVDARDSYRVIETETEDGWVHIVKHLRAEVTSIPQSASPHLQTLHRFLSNVKVRLPSERAS